MPPYGHDVPPPFDYDSSVYNNIENRNAECSQGNNRPSAKNRATKVFDVITKRTDSVTEGVRQRVQREGFETREEARRYVHHEFSDLRRELNFTLNRFEEEIAEQAPILPSRPAEEEFDSELEFRNAVFEYDEHVQTEYQENLEAFREDIHESKGVLAQIWEFLRDLLKKIWHYFQELLKWLSTAITEHFS